MKIGVYFFSLILTTLILINSTRASLNYAYYNLDPVGFIEALCKNQDKPELQCNGKCHLKKVAESQGENQNTPEGIIDFKELILYPSPLIDFVIVNKVHTKKERTFAYQNLYSFHNTSDCFHPPRV